MQTDPQVLGLCQVAPGELLAQPWHRFGLGRPTWCLEQRQRASEVNPAQSSLCKTISLLPEHPDADMGGTDVRKRRCKEECKHEPAATSCSRKGHLAQAVVMAVPVFPSLTLSAASPPISLPLLVHACLGEHHAPGWLPSITTCEQCQMG